MPFVGNWISMDAQGGGCPKLGGIVWDLKPTPLICGSVWGILSMDIYIYTCLCIVISVLQKMRLECLESA